MGSLTSVNFHRFPESILAEVIEEAKDGEISIRSHELEFMDREDGVLRPRSVIPITDAMLIDECATADGLRFDVESCVQRPNSH